MSEKIQLVAGSKQAASIAQSTARLNLWDGAVRSGKTIASIIRWAEYIAHAPNGGALAMIGKTERTLKRNILDPMKAIFPSFQYKGAFGEAEFLGRKIYLVGANDERAESKIRGVTLSGAYGDELTLWPENFFKMLLSRLSVPGAKFFGTTNPDSPRHWLKTEYLDRPELDIRTFHFLLTDNHSLSPAYVDSLRREYSGLWQKRFIDGLWVSGDGAIYDMFSDSHIVRIDIEPTRYVVGLDYGTTNPTAAVLLGDLGGGRYHVFREFYYDSRKAGRRKTDAQYIESLQAWAAGASVSKWAIDPEASSLIEAARQAGMSVSLAKNEVLPGIQTVSKLLANNRLSFDPACQFTIAEMQGYTWDTKAALRGDERPIKANDHAADALRYGCMFLERGGSFGASVPEKKDDSRRRMF